MKQPELIQPENLSPRLRWQTLFQFLPPWPEPAAKTGRKPLSRDALMRGCIYQRLTRRRFIRDVCTALKESPPLMAALGFDPYARPPSVERFSAFLSDTPHASFQDIRIELTRQLLDLGVLSPRHVGFDSCPIASWVKENNLKTALRHSRFDKTTPPKGDSDARVGVRIHFPSQRSKGRVDYYWGYRNHVLSDLESELPLWEITEPNSVGETSVAIPLLDSARSDLGVEYVSVTGDAEYDAESILKHIVELQAQPFIARNRRRSQNTSGFRFEGQHVICPANLRMYRRGKMTVKGVTYIQYSCPFYYGEHPGMLMCPVDHPKFSDQKGCNYLQRLTESIRDTIPYGTEVFKEHYNRRTAAERIFSRLLAVTIQEPSVRGLNSVRNHATLSHIAVLLVALAAHKLGHSENIRFVRTFVPNILE
jgi:hypothetical protein